MINRDDKPQFGAERLKLLVSRLAPHAVTDRAEAPPRRVVILGTATGVPSWADAHSALAAALALPVPTDRRAADVVRQYLSEKGSLGGQLFWCAYSMIPLGDPPLGYEHLANLVARGHVDVVLTTSWDPLLEIALSKIVPPTQYRVLTRGELGDGDFAGALLQRGIPLIVKLNGDLHAGLVTCADRDLGTFSESRAVADALCELFAGSVVVADVSGRTQPDGDVVALVTMAAEAGLLYEIGPAGGNPRADWSKKHAGVTSNTVTDLDIFMIELDRQAELVARDRSGTHSWPTHEQMIRFLELSTGSIPLAAVARYVWQLYERLANAGVDWIAYIDDPIAPGGIEIRRRLARTPIGALPSLSVLINTDGGNRLVGRHAVVPWNTSVPSGARIAVVDSAAFSGKTLDLASRALAARFEGIDVVPAVLVASKSIVGRIENGEKWLQNLVYLRVTERHDILFPWGLSSATDTVVRKLEHGPHGRQVKIFQRPWGSAEVFATSENCSARILSIDATQKLSFQRHLCRDELFVALDDDVGIDISADDFEGGIVDEFDSRIESITLEAGNCILIPRGLWHRVRGARTRVRILEIAFGIYDEEFDIERLLDLYGRADSAGGRT